MAWVLDEGTPTAATPTGSWKLDPDVEASITGNQDHFDAAATRDITDMPLNPLHFNLGKANERLGKEIKPSIEAGVTGAKQGALEGYQGYRQLGTQALESLGAIDKGSTAAYTQSVKDAGPVAGYREAQAEHPFAAGLGNIAGNAATMPVGASGVGANIALGALQGARQFVDKPEDRLTNTVKGAVVAGAIPAVIGTVVGAKNIISNTKTGIGALFTKTTDYVDDAINKTVMKAGGDISKASPEDFVSALSNTVKKAQATKDALYATRDAIAAKEGATVAKTNLQGFIDNIKANSTSSATGRTIQGLTADEAAVLKQAANIYADGAPISYQRAQTLISSIGSRANEASRAGNDNTARLYMNLKNSINQDIMNGTGSAALKEAQNAAQSFYQNTYAPLRNLNVKDVATGKFTEAYFTKSLMNSISKNSEARMTIQSLPKDVQVQFMGGVTNMLRESAEQGDKLNLNKFAQALDKFSTDSGPVLGDVGKDLKTLTQVIMAKNLANQSLDITGHSLGQAGAMGVLGSSAAFAVGANPLVGAAVGAGYLIKKAPFLYKAGKMLNNPAAKNLLNARELAATQGAASETVQFIDNKISKLWNNLGSQAAVIETTKPKDMKNAQ